MTFPGAERELEIEGVYGADRQALRERMDSALVELWRVTSAWLAEPSESQNGPRQLERMGELCKLVREARARLSN